VARLTDEQRECLIEFRTTVATGGPSAYHACVTTLPEKDWPDRPLPWPRLRRRDGWRIVVCVAMRQIGVSAPILEWTFNPKHLTVHGGAWPPLEPDPASADVLLAPVRLVWSAGGRRKGSMKGRPWTRRRCLDWWREASEDYADEGGSPTLGDLAQAMGVKSGQTARGRWEAVGLKWPPGR
jgi:hypothetical protein